MKSLRAHKTLTQNNPECSFSMSDADNPLTQHNCGLPPMSFHCQQKTKDSFHQLDLWNKPMRHALPECDKTLGAYLTTCWICVAHLKKREMNFHFGKEKIYYIVHNYYEFPFKSKQSLPSNQSTHRPRVGFNSTHLCESSRKSDVLHTHQDLSY